METFQCTVVKKSACAKLYTVQPEDKANGLAEQRVRAFRESLHIMVGDARRRGCRDHSRSSCCTVGSASCRMDPELLSKERCGHEWRWNNKRTRWLTRPLLCQGAERKTQNTVLQQQSSKRARRNPHLAQQHVHIIPSCTCSMRTFSPNRKRDQGPCTLTPHEETDICAKEGLDE